MPRRLTPPPSFIRPQLAELIDQAPAADQWIHEIKIDGYRIGARIAGGRMTMLTRKALDWTKRFGPAADVLAKQPTENAYGECLSGRRDRQSRPGRRLEHF